MKTGDTVEFTNQTTLGFADQTGTGYVNVDPGDRDILGLQRFQDVWEVHVNGGLIYCSTMYFRLGSTPAIPNYTFSTPDKFAIYAPAPGTAELKNPKVTKLCDCPIHQLMHGGCKCGGK